MKRGKTCIVSAFTLALTLLFCSSAWSGDAPKRNIASLVSGAASGQTTLSNARQAQAARAFVREMRQRAGRLVGDGQKLTRINYYMADGTPIGYETYEYNTKELLSRVSDFTADGELTNYVTYGYNGKNLVTTESYYVSVPDSGPALEYYYTYSYNSAKRKLKRIYNDLLGTKWYTTTYAYDGRGNLNLESTVTATKDLVRYTDYDYDSSDLLTKEVSMHFGRLHYTANYMYGEDGRLSRITYQDFQGISGSTGYEYNAQGLIAFESTYDYAGDLESYGEYVYGN